MLYELAHVLRDRLPGLWRVIGWVNSWLFACRYGKRMQGISALLQTYSAAGREGAENAYRIEALTRENTPLLARMLREQPAEAFTYFKPHGFDEAALQQLARDKSFLAYVVLAHDADNKMVCVGYFFQRSFCWGKTYRGYITDYRWRRRGINRLMNACATDIALLLGLRVFGTIAPANVASMKSAAQVNEVRIIETLANGDYLVAYLPKRETLSNK